MTQRMSRDEIRARQLADLPEKDFLAYVQARARWLGWATYHTHDSRRSAPGFPDLVAAKPGRLIFAELKKERAKPTAAQTEWLDRLGTLTEPSGGIVSTYLWRPSDMTDIDRILNE